MVKAGVLKVAPLESVILTTWFGAVVLFALATVNSMPLSLALMCPGCALGRGHLRSGVRKKGGKLRVPKGEGVRRG